MQTVPILRMPSSDQWWRSPRAAVWAWSASIWTLVCTAMVLALHNDALQRGVSVDLWSLWCRNFPIYLPLMVYSGCLYAVFQRWPERLDALARFVGLYVLTWLLFMPAYMVYQSALDMWWKRQALLGVSEMLARHSGYDWWTDTMLTALAFASQVAFSNWQRSQSRERALLVSQGNNLQLRLTQLQGQLEQHFLFNALNSISALVRGGERSLALSALNRLADLLRYAVRATRAEWVSVESELAFVRAYIELQELRFGSALSVHWSIEEAPWESFACPPLLIQPLVENAIRHGLEAQDGQGAITIVLKLESDQWVLRIENDLPTEDYETAGDGVGLTATRDRLTMLFGSAARLVASEYGRVFVVSLHCPLRDLHESLESIDR